MTSIMQVLSVLGDGEPYFYMIGVIYSFGYADDFCYLIVAYGLNFQWSSMLKQGLRDSRPQFDDPSLAVVNAGDCAGEFGNPSGHSLTAAQFCLTMYLFYKDKNRRFLLQNKWIDDIIKCSIFLYICAVSFCRFYLGRHSVD
mmetsp:Transcript_33348/g.44865  ORF Transcript_33348/g.44865 Transcript_33348/m.44865 type:complete len:142 (+) Transcript_33348:286-711(+)